jgi:hypothetical protein
MDRRPLEVHHHFTTLLTASGHGAGPSPLLLRIRGTSSISVQWLILFLRPWLMVLRGPSTTPGPPWSSHPAHPQWPWSWTITTAVTIQEDLLK